MAQYPGVIFLYTVSLFYCLCINGGFNHHSGIDKMLEDCFDGFIWVDLCSVHGYVMVYYRAEGVWVLI